MEDRGCIDFLASFARGLRAQAQSICPGCEQVGGLDACHNEGCAGWAGAEPHAWETAHDGA